MGNKWLKPKPGFNLGKICNWGPNKELEVYKGSFNLGDIYPNLEGLIFPKEGSWEKKTLFQNKVR